MRDLYQAFAEARKLNRERGFTLIELLVVIAIIAILAAIAIPQFAKYRVRAFNSAAESDLRNIRTTLEAVFADYQSYGNTDVALTTGTLSITTPGATTENISLSNGVYAGIDFANDGTNYTAASGHINGDRAFCADSDDSSIWWKTKSVGDTTAITMPTPGYGTNNCIGSGGYPNQL